MSGVMDFNCRAEKPWNTPQLTQHMWPELMLRPAPCEKKKNSAPAPVALSQHLFAFSLRGTTCTLHRQESTAALMTQTAQHYELYLPVALGLSPYGVLYTSPNMCSCGGLSQLAKPNRIYYLWKDINSRDCDPLRLNGPLKPSIILSSSSGKGNLCGAWDVMWFMQTMRICDTHYQLLAYEVWSIKLSWTGMGEGSVFFFSSFTTYFAFPSSLLLPLHKPGTT